MKVITTVGASLFENYQKKTGDNLRYYDLLKNKGYNQWRNLLDKINLIKNDNDLHKWINNNFEKSCAEISSVLEIKKRFSEMLEVRLIATETILSRLAAEIIKDKLNTYSVNECNAFSVLFEAENETNEVDVIRSLNVKNADDFQDKGLPNLIRRLKEFGISNDRMILNMTGGYKGIIPFLTILGQIYKDVEIKYLYEDSGQLITIPGLPVNFDWVIQEKFFSFCIMSGISSYKDRVNFGADSNDDFSEDILPFFERVDNGEDEFKLSALGALLFDRIAEDEIESRRVLGFLMEYRMIKHFGNYGLKFNDKIYDIVEKPKKDSLYNKEEIDLVLKSYIENKDEYIAVEVKSYLSRKNLKTQVEKQVAGFKKLPRSYVVILYSFVSLSQRDYSALREWFNNNIVNKKDIWPDECVPMLGVLCVDWDKYKYDANGNKANSYKEFMSSDDKLDIEYLV